MNTQWQQISSRLQNELDPGSYRTWIAPLAAEVKEGNLLLQARNAYTAGWLQNRLLGQLKACACDVLGENASVSISVQENAPKAEVPHTEAPKEQVCQQAMLPISFTQTRTKKNWRYSFEDLVVGQSNRMAVAAAQDVCRINGSVQTLYVNASAGLGKTHLAQAVGQDICENLSEQKVDYLTAEEFSARYVASLKTHEVEDFKDRLRSTDVLLLEDVHFLQNKPKIQETALSIVKGIQDHGGRVIFTSSFSPRELQKVDSQLVSSFCSGILAHIDGPDEAMRCEIIRRKAASLMMPISDAICEILARNLGSDVRQIESCLQSLLFKAQLLKSTVTEEMAYEVLHEYAGLTSMLDLQCITQLVCKSFGLDKNVLNSRSRCQSNVLGRNTIFYLARKHTSLTLKEIGQPFNRRHSTVLQGITSVERELSKDSTLGRQIARAIALVEQEATRTAV